MAPDLRKRCRNHNEWTKRDSNPNKPSPTDGSVMRENSGWHRVLTPAQTRHHALAPTMAAKAPEAEARRATNPKVAERPPRL